MENDKELEKVISEEFEKAQTANIMIGAQAMCTMILNKIKNFENSDGKKSTNDYKRLVKDVKNFCLIGVSKKINKEK